MTLHPDPVPLRADADGNIYLGTSRVLLDTVVNHYRQGLSADVLARGHDTITLADVHAVVATICATAMMWTPTFDSGKGKRLNCA